MPYFHERLDQILSNMLDQIVSTICDACPQYYQAQELFIRTLGSGPLVRNGEKLSEPLRICLKQLRDFHCINQNVLPILVASFRAFNHPQEMTTENKNALRTLLYKIIRCQIKANYSIELKYNMTDFTPNSVEKSEALKRTFENYLSATPHSLDRFFIAHKATLIKDESKSINVFNTVPWYIITNMQHIYPVHVAQTVFSGCDLSNCRMQIQPRRLFDFIDLSYCNLDNCIFEGDFRDISFYEASLKQPQFCKVSNFFIRRKSKHKNSDNDARFLSPKSAHQFFKKQRGAHLIPVRNNKKSLEKNQCTIF
tara:strand:+ start:278 stop:1207 length:930 start_codon:yes stop_codon:yes gene_type:complete